MAYLYLRAKKAFSGERRGVILNEGKLVSADSLYARPKRLYAAQKAMEMTRVVGAKPSLFIARGFVVLPLKAKIVTAEPEGKRSCMG